MDETWMSIAGMGFVLGLLTLLTVVVVIALQQAATTRRARVAVTRELEYRSLAERAVAAEERTAAEMEHATARLERLEAALAAAGRPYPTSEAGRATPARP